MYIVKNGEYGFDVSETANLGAREISNEIYQQILSTLQEQKTFKIKNINGIGFNDIFEQFIEVKKAENVEEASAAIVQDQILDIQSMIIDLAYNNLIGGM